MTGRLPFRAPTEDDSELVELLWRVETDESALRSLGFTALGDLILQPIGGEISAIARVLVDGDHTTCAFLMMFPQRPSAETLYLESHTLEEQFTTRPGAPWASLACPPFFHRQFVDATTRHERLVAQHRTLGRLDGAPRSFVTIATLDDLLHVLRRKYEMTARWRDEQAPGELLDADLRSLLGASYPHHGQAATLHLAALPPTAIALRRGR